MNLRNSAFDEIVTSCVRRLNLQMPSSIDTMRWARVPADNQFATNLDIRRPVAQFRDDPVPEFEKDLTDVPFV
jgi:hypothetical protein